MNAIKEGWPPLSEIDGETEQLVYLVDEGWVYEWPGWKWVASWLNQEYGNNRTPQACRSKYGRIMKGRRGDEPQERKDER